MFRQKLSPVEILVLVVVAILVVTGLILYTSNVARFEWFVQEDNIVEWLTVLGLLMASFVCLARVVTLWKKRSFLFLLINLLLGLFLFFAAGEEISWGQRILGIESSEYFQKNNAQGETNLHNLVVDGVKINKLIFTAVLGTGVAIYLLLFPWLFQKNEKIRKGLNQWGIPVAQWYQVIAIVLIAGLTSLIPHGKNAELLEAGACLIFFLVIQFPANKNIFTKTLSDRH